MTGTANPQSANDDGVETAIFASRARSIASIVGSTLMQGSRSTLMQQGDLAAGLMDATGRVIALDEHLPLMAYSLSPAVKALREFFGEDIADGDVFIHNDVWHGNIQHADVGIFIPVFAGGTLIAWVGCRGHWSDIGGAVEGTVNPSAVEVWQESLRIPPLRLARASGPCRDVWNMVFCNVRMRDRVESDARGQIGACRIGAAETLLLVERSGGVTGFLAMVDRLFSASARALDATLGLLPQGRFEGTSVYIDDSPAGIETFPIKVAVEISHARIDINFAGTGISSSSMMNAPIESTRAAALVTILTMLGPDIAHDEGVLSRFSIEAPEGSMLNVAFPKASSGGNKLCEYIGLAINDALRDVMPTRISAEWSRRLSMRVGGTDSRNGGSFHEIFFLTYAGGGAAQGADGYHQPGLMSGGNVQHKDYEAMELDAPLVVWKHEYAPHLAGEGQWRGGHGNETIVEYYGRDMFIVTHGGGTIEGASGVLGGGNGSVNTLELTMPDGARRIVHARERIANLNGAIVTRQVTGGGGGYGLPASPDRGNDSDDGLAKRAHQECAA